MHTADQDTGLWTSVVNNFNQVDNLQNLNFLVFLFRASVYFENKIKKIPNIDKLKNTKILLKKSYNFKYEQTCNVLGTHTVMCTH